MRVKSQVFLILFPASSYKLLSGFYPHCRAVSVFYGGRSRNPVASGTEIIFLVSRFQRWPLYRGTAFLPSRVIIEVEICLVGGVCPYRFSFSLLAWKAGRRGGCLK